MRPSIVFCLLFFLSWGSTGVQAQENRLEELRAKLKLAVIADTAYLSKIDLSVANMPLGELLRHVAKASEVSINYHGDHSLLVNSNLSRVKITDLLFSLCRDYNLDVEVAGNIVSVFPYAPPLPDVPQPRIDFHPVGPSISYQFRQTPLSEVVKMLADQSGINIVFPAELTYHPVSGYAVRMPTEAAVRSLAQNNGMSAKKENSNLWQFDPLPVRQEGGASADWLIRSEITEDQLEIDAQGRITTQIQQGSIYDILCTLCERMELNYYFISPVEGQTSLSLKSVELHTLLKVLFTGTPFSYYEEEGIYMFGASREEVLASVRVIPLENRTVNQLVSVIPPDLKQGVAVDSFADLNSLVLSGDQRKVGHVESFIRSVDKTVPLVTIEVLIVDAAKSRKNEQGVSVSIGEGPVSTTGSLWGEGIHLELESKAINSLINSFNGFGSINLEKVNPNFYASLKLMEANGEIEIQSTPKLSTLNGHEAELTSGERRHYKEVQESLMGSQNPVQPSS
ncbi:MAG: type II secretion system protein GspD, partial [Rikenellaceae bacterium]|nr:type II secretion system protein GspD [Rikenellaceae bacterium]